MLRWVAFITLAACGSKSIDKERAAALYTEVVLDTEPGLSGLALDDDNNLWTVSERGNKAY
nr:hypothetical protein [Deltaproteobacteria bacterium]